MINSQTYKRYLFRLKDKVFKVIPLYQEQSPTIDKYIDAICFDLYGLNYTMEEMYEERWYVTTLNVLECVRWEYGDFRDFQVVRSQLLNLLNIIDREIKELERNESFE